MSPIVKYISCPKCSAQSGFDCVDALGGTCSDRIHLFIQKAATKQRFEAQEWTFQNVPTHVKKLFLQENDSIYLNEEEHKIWCLSKENEE